MIPKTLSASSLQVWTLCPDRWVAEYLERAPSFSNSAADVGTAFHAGAEMFVKAIFTDKTHDITTMTRKQQKELLITFYQMGYIQTFNSADLETEEFKDGLALTMRWFERTDLTTKPMVGVESTELKETIEVPYNHPDGTVHQLNFNYIMDRVDQIEKTVWEVVDYKTIRVPLQPDDLEDKIQARAYALAIQIKHPEATKVIVTFDQIRHEPISRHFTRDDNIAFWRFLTAETSAHHRHSTGKRHAAPESGVRLLRQEVHMSADDSQRRRGRHPFARARQCHRPDCPAQGADQGQRANRN